MKIVRDGDQIAQEVRWLQTGIALVFLILGAWCLLAPASIVSLVIREGYRNYDPLTLIAIGAFGAQAMLSGLFAGSTTFTRTTFLAYGLVLLPFFVFDYWVYALRPIMNELILLDAAGNVIMLGLCIRGWWILRKPLKE